MSLCFYSLSMFWLKRRVLVTGGHRIAKGRKQGLILLISCTGSSWPVSRVWAWLERLWMKRWHLRKCTCAVVGCMHFVVPQCLCHLLSDCRVACCRGRNRPLAADQLKLGCCASLCCLWDFVYSKCHLCLCCPQLVHLPCQGLWLLL